jgi:hypothetical protein
VWVGVRDCACVLYPFMHIYAFDCAIKLWGH